MPTSGSDPQGIAAGPDGALWFTEQQGDKIGRISTSGVITEYPVPTAGAGYNNQPYGIATGPDGALWFTESNTSQIGRITTAGVITEYGVPSAIGSGPSGITAGPDGELWFTEYIGDIGEAVFVTADLSASPARGSIRAEIAFTGGMFAPNEAIQIYTSGVGSAVLATATADAGGSFTATARQPQSPFDERLFLGVGQTSGRLGAARFFVAARLILSAASGTVGSAVTAQGYSFGSFETVKIYWNNPRLYWVL